MYTQQKIVSVSQNTPFLPTSANVAHNLNTIRLRFFFSSLSFLHQQQDTIFKHFRSMLSLNNGFPTTVNAQLLQSAFYRRKMFMECILNQNVRRYRNKPQPISPLIYDHFLDFLLPTYYLGRG